MADETGNMTISLTDPYRDAKTQPMHAGTRVEPDGAANRSQPVRAETNQTSAAAGAGR